MNFGEFLREAREKRGLTVNQLAIYAEVSSGLISKLENGKRGTPKPETIEKLAKGLKMEYEELMSKAGYVAYKGKREVPKKVQDSLMDMIVKEAEAHYKVNLTDDPDIHKAVQEYIHTLAKMKSKQKD